MSTKEDSAHLQLDPGLIALAAQVQAHANAERQASAGTSPDHGGAEGGMNGVAYEGGEKNDVMESGQGMDCGEQEEIDDSGRIDPSLALIEQVVNDVQEGHIRLDAHAEDPSLADEQVHEEEEGEDLSDGSVLSEGEEQGHEMSEAHEHDGMRLDDEIDPTLREIVNSLTNAQQSNHMGGPGLSHAQAAAAIGAHLTDVEEREKLQQSLQNTFADLTHESFSSLFPQSFQSPGQNYLHLSDNHHIHDPSHVDLSSSSLDLNAEAGPSSAPLHSSTPSSDPSQPMHPMHPMHPNKRGRGRPKGSKNKPKPGPPVVKPPKPPKPPARPKGRPPKERTPAEQAEYELRKQERELGVKRQKGRPRKFPGYLVREMRLKKNRDEFNQLMRHHEEQRRHDSLENLEIDMEGVGQLDGSMAMERIQADGQSSINVHDDHEHDFSSWSVQDDQTLLDVVGVGHHHHHHHHHHGMDVGLGQDEDHHGHGGMEEVFGLGN